MKAFFNAIAFAALFVGVVRAENQVATQLGPSGSEITLTFTYPTSTSEHRTKLDIDGHHGSEDVQLQSDDYNYIIRYRVNGVVYQHLFTLTTLSPANVTINTIECDVDFEDGDTGYFEYQPMPGAGDATHPAIDFQASDTDYVHVVTGNKIDSVIIGGHTLAAVYLNKGGDFYAGSGTGEDVVHSGLGYDIVNGGGGTQDVLWTGPSTGGVYDGDSNFETVNEYEWDNTDWFPMTQW